jgi:FtsH-binding integral membrane protein
MTYQPQAYGAAVKTQSLLGQVLGITALGMAVTAFAVYLFPNGSGGPNWLAFAGTFILIFVMNAVRQNTALSLLIFYVFTFLEGIVLSPIIGYYAHTAGNQVVYNAALTTALGMFALGAIVYGTGLDLRRFQGWVMGALLILVLVGIASMFFRFLSPTVYSWATLAIFSVLVLIDFARIRAGGDGLTAPQIAISIYLDAINIFLAILQITGSRRSND